MDEMENLIAQSKKEKSLYKTIKPIVEKDDFELVRINELDKAVNVLNDALIVAKNNNDNPGIAGINIVYGAIYKSWGRYEKAIEYYEDALAIRVKEKNLQDEAKVLNGLAQCYASLNKNEEAFKYYNRSIEIKKSIDDKQGVANSLSNLLFLSSALTLPKINKLRTKIFKIFFINLVFLNNL